jgi:hypothetical protein
MTIPVEPQLILGIASILLALAFDLIPGLKASFDLWDPIAKRWFMIGLIAASVAGAYGLSYFGLLPWFQVGWAGVLEAVFVFVVSVLANQGIHGPVAKYQRDKEAELETEAVG